jgi:hypothetical protein
LAALEPVISEIMYHPAAVGTNASDNTDHEYVVIQNDTGADVDLWNTVGPWRINGIGYTLPSNTVISNGAALTIVAFDPGDAVAVSNFLAAHNLSGTSPDLLGPHNGTLSNTGERLALERPQAADFPDPDISWVTVDEVIYSASTPWPNASTNGTALYRIDLRHSGNDPLNWTAQQPALARLKVNGADFQVSEGVLGGNYVIDAQEVTRILTFWRAGSYSKVSVDGDHPDGYTPGTGGTQEGSANGADYQTSDVVPGANWTIDASEVTRILTFWRAGGYHVWPGGPDAEHPDGFAPGPGTED